MPRRGYRTTAAGFVAAVALLSAVGVAGCDSHSKPTVPTEAPQSPDPVMSPSASVSTSLTAPAHGPSSAQGSPIVGGSALASAFPSAAAAEPAAIAVVRQFFDGVNHEIDTGEENAVTATFSSQCVQCIQGVVDIKNHMSDGHKFRGGHLHLISVDKAVPTYATLVRVIVTQTEDSGSETDAAGNVISNYPSSSAMQFAYEVDISKSPVVIVQLTRVGA